MASGICRGAGLLVLFLAIPPLTADELEDVPVDITTFGGKPNVSALVQTIEPQLEDRGIYVVFPKDLRDIAHKCKVDGRYSDVRGAEFLKGILSQCGLTYRLVDEGGLALGRVEISPSSAHECPG